MKKYFPNVLTSFRGISAIVIAGLFLSNLESKFLIAYTFFALATISDFFDGYLARRWKVTTELGAILDPLFDKVLVLTLLLLIFPLKILPSFIIIILFIRDVAIDSIRSFMLSHGTVVPAIKTAKLKTTSQMLALNFVLLFLVFPQEKVLKEIGIFMGLVAVVFSLWSAFVYCKMFIKFLKQSSEK